MKAWQATGILGAVIFTGMLIHQLGANTPGATVPDAMPDVAANLAPPASGRDPMPGSPPDRPSFEERWRQGPDAGAEQAAAPALAAVVPEPSAGPGPTAEPGPGLTAVSGPSLGAAPDAGAAKAVAPVLASLAPEPSAGPATRTEPDSALPAVSDPWLTAALPVPTTRDASNDANGAPVTQDFRYLIWYVWSETPPAEKPAAIVLRSFKDIPLGTVAEEIKRASDAFGLDFNYMKAVAKIESGFDPKQRTGSYIGLFQLSKYEFSKFGSGDILNPRDNAVAAAYKIITEGILFQWVTGRKPDLNDLYLIHQQGWEGAAEHISRPDRIAWKSMCATSEGREKGEKWCRRAIWGNTLPSVKDAWKSVDKLTSEAFVGMWRERVAHFYAKYMSTATADAARGRQ